MLCIFEQALKRNEIYLETGTVEEVADAVTKHGIVSWFVRLIPAWAYVVGGTTALALSFVSILAAGGLVLAVLAYYVFFVFMPFAFLYQNIRQVWQKCLMGAKWEHDSDWLLQTLYVGEDVGLEESKEEELRRRLTDLALRRVGIIGMPAAAWSSSRYEVDVRSRIEEYFALASEVRREILEHVGTEAREISLTWLEETPAHHLDSARGAP